MKTSASPQRVLSLLTLAVTSLVFCPASGQSQVLAPAVPPRPAILGDLPTVNPDSLTSQASPEPTPAPPKLVAQAGGNAFGGVGGFGTYPGYRTSAAKDAIPPVVVLFTNAEAAALQNLEEDLTIMSHILSQTLERELGEDAPPSKLGVPLVLTAPGRSVRSMYLEGLGPLFMIKLNMALVEPATEDKPVGASRDTEWDTARREVLGLSSADDLFKATGVSAEVPYDPEQVAALKRCLIGAFKNAANIRNLKSEEFVSMTVFGQPTAIQSRKTVSAIFTPDGKALHTTAADGTVRIWDANTGEELAGEAEPTPGKATSSKPAKSGRKNSASRAGAASAPSTAAASAGALSKGSVLTLRAKVADVQGFAATKLSLDEFTKRVTVLAYPGSGYSSTSINSWIQSGRNTSNVRF